VTKGKGIEATVVVVTLETMISDSRKYKFKILPNIYYLTGREGEGGGGALGGQPNGANTGRKNSERE